MGIDSEVGYMCGTIAEITTACTATKSAAGPTRVVNMGTIAMATLTALICSHL